MATWQDRLKAVIGPRGYENCMRRSLQTAILYEAKRCVANRLPSLRPFQRKAAFMDQAFALLDSLDFLYPHQKAEILWRTASSKEQLGADIAWKREKGIEKELTKLSEQIKPFVSKAKTHEEACNLLVQSLYETLTKFEGKAFPLNWEHAHNHCIMTYRMYYKFDKVDPDFPAPISPREVVVPTERPKSIKSGPKVPGAASAAGQDPSEPQIDVAELLGDKKEVDDRRKVLQEVRDHLDLLKQFEGVISDEEIAKRKRELFAALPAAPPPAVPSPGQGSSKKLKPTSADV